MLRNNAYSNCHMQSAKSPLFVYKDGMDAAIIIITSYL